MATYWELKERAAALNVLIQEARAPRANRCRDRDRSRGVASLAWKGVGIAVSHQGPGCHAVGERRLWALDVVLEPAPPILLHREQCRYARELWHALTQGATDQQQHCRVCGELGGQPSHGEEATNAMDGRGSALPGTGQSGCSQRRILG